MSAVARSVGGVRARLGGRSDAYAFCATDKFWFRPLYTEGKCPLCGEAASEAAPPLGWAMRFDRFMLGLVVLGLVSLAMCALVLAIYFGA